MQGKYQLVVYQESGHHVMQDVPDKLAVQLVEFWTRNQPLKIIKRFPISTGNTPVATSPSSSSTLSSAFTLLPSPKE